MDVDVDHYAILGLPSGGEGAKLTEKEISKAFRLKALELHPDKRSDDPNAHEDFQKLNRSYKILKDEKERKLFDDLIRARQEKIQRQSFQDSKRRKMMSDLEERERAAFSVDDTKARAETERTKRQLKDDIARIRATFGSKKAPAPPTHHKEASRSSKGNTEDGSNIDKGKVLKVSWGKTGKDYTAQRLREIFGEIGIVEDVVIRGVKRSALVVMASKDAAAAVAATRNVLGDISNPLSVLPLNPVQSPIFSGARSAVESDEPPVGAGFQGFEKPPVGAGFQAFEELVMEKLKKAAEKQKQQQNGSGS